MEDKKKNVIRITIENCDPDSPYGKEKFEISPVACDSELFGVIFRSIYVDCDRNSELTYHTKYSVVRTVAKQIDEALKTLIEEWCKNHDC